MRTQASTTMWDAMWDGHVHITKPASFLQNPLSFKTPATPSR